MAPMAEIMGEACAKPLDLLLGRKTNEIFAARWPHFRDRRRDAAPEQAGAVIAARRLIVRGAVSMVQDALEQLAVEKIVELDEERKAAMVSNLMVVITADRSAKPVVNVGTLYPG